MRRFFAAAAAAVLCAACSARQMDLAAAVPALAGQAQTQGLALEVDTPFALTLNLPDRTFSLEVTADNPALEVLRDGDALTLTGRLAGDYTLSCAVRAKGYRDETLSIPVHVSLRPMALSTSGGETHEAPAQGNTLGLMRGESASFALIFKEGAALCCQTADPAVASAHIEDGRLLIDALYPGETTVSVEAQKDGYTPAALSFTVSVSPTKAALGLSSGSLSLTRGQPAFLPAVWESVGTLSVVDAPAQISVVPVMGGLSITANASGSYPLLVRCEADGFLPAEAALNVTASDPAVTLRVSSPAALAQGDSAALGFTVLPADAQVSVSATGGVEAEVSGASISIYGRSAGSARLTVTASREGYQSASATVEITVTAPALSSPYPDLADEIIALTNRERKDAGLSPLKHIAALDSPATLRAREASQSWSHTRPDGRDFYTALEDYGLFYRGKGENLFSANVLDAALAVENWMASYSHRENLLLPAFTGIGVSIVKGSDGFYYYSQLFVHD